MKLLVLSLVRIAVATVLGIALILVVLGSLVRQPSLGSIPYTVEERADPSRLEEHVRYLSQTLLPRNPRNLENLDAAADYVAARLSASGGRVAEQRYVARGKACRNIRARFGPKEGPLLIVGAHYDVYGDLPGADDNASGVAGLLELGRLLGLHPPEGAVELVAFSTEEPPFFGGPEMGSAVYARSLREAKVRVAGMICLEMIGYFTERQPSPHWAIGLVYPRRGDFVAVVGRWKDRRLVRHVKAGIKGGGRVRACSFTGPPILGAGLSDHRNFWAGGYRAVMVTDTAYIRNRNYHTSRDLPETLDYERMAGVVDGVFNAVRSFHAAAGE
ncbi:MAG: M28 family peptidase [Bacteroidetes bacterium]|nr:MAG: M28 family peptidase [Bacteroidota bacterium]